MREDVDDHDLVGEIEDEVTLRGIAPLGERDRLELEGQVVAEGAVQPELHLEIVPEEIDQRWLGLGSGLGLGLGLGSGLGLGPGSGLGSGSGLGLGFQGVVYRARR